MNSYFAAMEGDEVFWFWTLSLSWWTSVWTLFLCVQKPSVATMTSEKITRLYEMGSEPERRLWVDRYLSFMEDRGTPVHNLPAVGKKPLDLCRFYLAVRQIGGLAMVRLLRSLLSSGVGRTGGQVVCCPLR